MIPALTGTLLYCLQAASGHYGVPWQVMAGIFMVEGGRPGLAVANTNGTHDLGPMQINTLWLPQLAEHWGVSRAVAKKAVRDDACSNMMVAAWILRTNYGRNQSWYQAVRLYHSATPGIGDRYANKVIRAMSRRGLIDWGENSPRAVSAATSTRAVNSSPSALAALPRQKPTLLAQR